MLKVATVLLLRYLCFAYKIIIKVVNKVAINTFMIIKCILIKAYLNFLKETRYFLVDQKFVKNIIEFYVIYSFKNLKQLNHSNCDRL